MIDDSIAFLGGLDMCFGRYATNLDAETHLIHFALRWDTPQHALVDDPENAEEQIWLGATFTFCKLIIVDAILGKDYANERVLEFHTLSKPFEDMYNRTKVPRMPW